MRRRIKFATPNRTVPNNRMEVGSGTCALRIFELVTGNALPVPAATKDAPKFHLFGGEIPRAVSRSGSFVSVPLKFSVKAGGAAPVNTLLLNGPVPCKRVAPSATRTWPIELQAAVSCAHTTPPTIVMN